VRMLAVETLEAVWREALWHPRQRRVRGLERRRVETTPKRPKTGAGSQSQAVKACARTRKRPPTKSHPYSFM
jgi:hypothetical protein